MSSALSRDGKLSAGPQRRVPSAFHQRDYGGRHEGTARVPVPDGQPGRHFRLTGRGSTSAADRKFAVYEFSLLFSQLKPTRTVEIAPGVKPSETDFIGDVAVSPDGKTVYAADLYHDSVAVVDLQSGPRLRDITKPAMRPYRILIHPDGKSCFVSSWADGTVYWHEARTGSRLRVLLGPRHGPERP